tara:strand:+ start:334 stop:546 length:213 start_codon:yes stop_codon:yes gene_type:complete
MPAGKISSINANMLSVKYFKNLYNKNKEVFHSLLAILLGFLFAKFVLSNNSNFLIPTKELKKNPEKKCGR